MTSFRYTPPSGAGAPQDIFQLASPEQPAFRRQLLPARYEPFRVPSKAGVYGMRLVFEDFGQGIDKPVGQFARHYNKLATSTLDSRYLEGLTLPFLTTAGETPDVGAGTVRNIMMANIFDTLVMAVRTGVATTNPVLFKETSATDPTVTSLSWAQTGQVTSLAPIRIGGATALRLCVGIQALASNILSDAASPPTVDGTLTNVTDLTGMIQTPLPGEPILFYAGAGLQSLLASDALTASPTQLLTGINGGGYALGLLSMGGSRLRAWWVWPKAGTVVTQVLQGEAPSRIMSTNLEGTDPTEYVTPLPYVIHAAIVRNGLICSEGDAIYYTNGRQKWFLPFRADPAADSDRVRKCRGFYVKEDDLYIEVNEIATNGATAGTNTKRYVLKYDWEQNIFHQVSAVTTLSTTGILSLGGQGGQLPFSDKTGFLHMYADGSWYRQFQPHAEVNPFSLRQTSGGGSSTGQEVEASGTATTPYLWLPGAEGLMCAVKRIRFRGDVDAGGAAGTAAAVDVTAGGITAYFRPGYANQAQVYEVPDHELNWVHQLQVSIAAARSAANTRLTPQCLPIDVELYIATDEMRPPPFLPEQEA